ncbi:Gfo/Idh/MocA family protein [Bacteroidota bacterium]
MDNRVNRREFMKTASAAGLGLSIANFPVHGNNAPSETLVAGVVGVRSRGTQLAKDIVAIQGMTVGYMCDVDDEYLEKSIEDIGELQKKKPVGFKDMRKLFEQKDLDVVFIATPDHWHAPAAIMALQAGKHVYVEKPCGHNPREGELLVEAQMKYGGLVQLGNQRRSSPELIQSIKEIKEGIIGKPYFAKAWYANRRASIDVGKVVPVKKGLDWDLFQGPAPRTPYRDNVHPYNWHWFWRWGTGEICNNGTHSIDVCRWALGVDIPVKVTSSGGRYHFDDDWEFCDTQVASFEFEEGKAISWEGRSCNDKRLEGAGVGVIINGTEGTAVILDSKHEFYDIGEKLVKTVELGGETDTTNLVSGGSLTQRHIANLRDGITKEEALKSPIVDGAISVLMCHLGNIAQKTGHTLNLNPKTGNIINDPEAMKMWSRQYEPGWEPKV